MPEQNNRRIVLATRPEGLPGPDTFRFEEEPAPVAGPGQAVARNLWLSVDPYMRGRISDRKSYARPIEIGEVMIGGTVSQIVASNHPLARVGDLVLIMGGWQDYRLLGGDEIRSAHRLERSRHLSTALGVAGMPGATAYCGLNYLGKPQPGETLVVSAAAGAVGSVVGQLAKMAGCRVVGVAGGPEKCRLCEDEFGFDACIDYKNCDDLAEAMRAACPDGIDIYFENVGGAVLEAVIPLLNDGARVPICGYISQYNEADPTPPTAALSALERKIESRFFLVSEWAAEFPRIYHELAQEVASGRLKYRETVKRGLEAAPEALSSLFSGRNVGKQVVRIASPT